MAQCGTARHGTPGSATLSVASVRRCCAEGGTWEGTARPGAGRGKKQSPLPRSRWSCGCPGSRENTDPAAWRGPGTPERDKRQRWAQEGTGQPPRSTSPRCHLSYLVGGHGHDPVQVLHQLLEGGSLGRDGVPAIPHHHVPARAGGGRGSARGKRLGTPTHGSRGAPGMCPRAQAGTHGQ